MREEKAKALFDACYKAKRIRELLPELPEGVTSSYIHFLDAIERMERERIHVKVSDISDFLRIPRPGVTRTANEMERKGFIRKTESAEDGRVTYITVTESGRKLSEAYNGHFFSQLVQMVPDISDDDADCTVRTLEKLYGIMTERRISID